MSQAIDPQTLAHLESHGYDGSRKRNRPVLICDVDEVVLHLVDPFEKVLNERGFELKTHAFRLTGNVFHIESGREASQAEVWDALTVLFEEQESRQGLVDGVVEGLNTVSESADILFLTNCPHPFHAVRERHLKANGLDYPLVTNTGSKVSAIGTIMEHHEGPAGFVDDTPRNLDQAREAHSTLDLFHFMADERFRELAQDVEGVHFSSGDWSEASRHISAVLGRER